MNVRLAAGLPAMVPALLLTLAGCVGTAGTARPLPNSATATAPAVGARPNLIVVLSDDHRWDALGAAGNPAIVTPVMDRLAHEGIYFRQATASVSQCHPVRASLITGLPAFRHGIHSTQHQEPGAAEVLCRRPTVPGLLRESGYHTVLVGKWHVPALPADCGFDEVRTWLPGGGSAFRDPELVRGMDHDHDADPSEAYEVVPGFTQEIFADDAVGFLKSDSAKTGPFLLWLGFTAPHYPYEPNPERIEALYAGRSPEQLQPPGFPQDVAANDWLHYDQAVSHLDEQLGRVLAALREAGLDERTVVVFLGDNGAMMGERGLGGPGSRAMVKQVPYEASLRVPFLLSGPGLPKALASDLPVSSLDLPPTLLALAGLPAPADWPGRDLTAALAGRSKIQEAFSEWSDEESERFADTAFRSVRTPAHKLIVWKDPARGEELYDLVADPLEARNLVAAPEAQDALRDLRARLLAWMRRNDDPALAWPAVSKRLPGVKERVGALD